MMMARRSLRSSMARTFAARQRAGGSSTVVLTTDAPGLRLLDPRPRLTARLRVSLQPVQGERMPGRGAGESRFPFRDRLPREPETKAESLLCDREPMTEPTDTRRPPASEHPGTPQTCTDDLDEDHVPPLALLSAHQATGALPRG